MSYVVIHSARGRSVKMRQHPRLQPTLANEEEPQNEDLGHEDSEEDGLMLFGARYLVNQKLGVSANCEEMC